MLKGLPLAYQRDLQEDKAPLFDAVAVYEASLGVLAGMLDTLTVDAERMRAAADTGLHDGHRRCRRAGPARRPVPGRPPRRRARSSPRPRRPASSWMRSPDDVIVAALGVSGRSGGGRARRRTRASARRCGRRLASMARCVVRRGRRHGAGPRRGRARGRAQAPRSESAGPHRRAVPSRMPDLATIVARSQGAAPRPSRRWPAARDRHRPRRRVRL